jgi:hypothetical protein
MPIVVVKQEKTLAALTARLLKARTSKAAKERAAHAIREANPGLDLDRLRPGTVVVVPRLAEARDDSSDLVVAALGPFFDHIRTELESLTDTARSALEADQDEREATASVLEADEVRAAAQNDPVLAETLERLRSTLADDGDIAVDNTDNLLNGIEQWFSDLDDLSTLW